MVKANIHCPIHLGSFNIRHRHWLHKRLWLTCRWFKNCGLFTSICATEIEDSCEIMEFSLEILVLATWAEFIFGLCISGLWILGLWSLSSRNNNNKDSTYFTHYMQAYNTIKSKLHCV